MDAEIEMNGFNEALAALKQLTGPKGARARQRALAAGARIARTAARKTTAFTDITGRLRKSIRVKNVKGRAGHEPSVILMAGGRGAEQAFLVEYGHGGPHPAPARPFLEPAVARNQSRIFQKIEERASKELEKLWG